MKEAQVGGGAEEWAHMSAATILMVMPALVFAAFGMRAIGTASARRTRRVSPSYASGDAG